MARQYSKVKKGMVFWFDPKSYGGGVDFRNYTGNNGREYKSHIQAGYRPYLVVSNDTGNSTSPTCNIVPITTSSEKAEIPVHVPFIFEGEPQIILCEQPRTVDIMALGKFHCIVSDEIMVKVEQALSIQFGIRPEIGLTDFTLDNTVKMLESMVEKILQSKMKRLEETAAKIPISNIEDAALRLGEMVEDLVISDPHYLTKSDSQLQPVSQPTKEDPAPKLEEVERKGKTSQIKPGKEQSYRGMRQIEKFNQRYNKGNEGDETPKETKEKPVEQKRKRNSWTTESRKAYLKDCDTLTPQEVMKKYGFTSIQSVFQTKYACKNALGIR